MEIYNPGIMIAAVKSGSGKTTVTCALLEALKKRGLKPCAFKCGPDYIDPMFHKKVIGVPSHNLDSFFSTTKQLKDIYNEYARDCDTVVVEGAMGLFDGLGGIREEGSAYHIASILNLPVILVIDAHGMGRTILPLIAGFLKYDREKRIKGVMLNKISDSFYKNISPVIEDEFKNTEKEYKTIEKEYDTIKKELRVKALGYLPEKKEYMMESRYLGLKLPEEILNLKKQICRMAEDLENCADVDKIIEISGKVEKTQHLIKQEENCHFDGRMGEPGKNHIPAVIIGAPDKIKIGIANDEAFCFYYEENLKLLEKEGARLIFFSPLKDKEIPKHLDGIILGGGYPELYAGQLEKNETMRESIKEAVNNGIPSLAECGGFMYLHESLTDGKGETFYMCKVLPGKCFYAKKSVRFGYIELNEKKEAFLNCKSIKGHEFHYFDSDLNGGDCIAKKPVTGRSWECVHSSKNHFWGFPHLYYPSNPDFAKHFIEEARLFHEKFI